MPAIRIATFGGMVPAQDARILPDNAATLSENVWLVNGTLQGWKAHRQLRALTNSTTEAVYRIPINTAEAANFSNSLWLEFDDPTATVIRAPMLQDTHSRYYFLGSDLDPSYNSLYRIQNDLPALKLGIPAPGAEPSLVATSGYVLNAEVVVSQISANPAAIRWSTYESVSGTTRAILNIGRTSNVATISVDPGHDFEAGDFINVTSTEYGVRAPVANTQRFITYVSRSSDVATITTSTAHGLAVDDLVRVLPTTASEYAEVSGGSSSVSTNSRTDGVVLIVTSSAHGLEAGDAVRIATSNSDINGDFIITSVPSSTSFTYTKSGADYTSAAYTGTAKKLTAGFGGTFTVTAVTSTTFSYTSAGLDVASTADTGTTNEMTTGFAGLFEVVSTTAATLTYASTGGNVVAVATEGNVTKYRSVERSNTAGSTSIGSVILEPADNTTEMITRSYVYTYVTEFGEESAPSPAVVKTGAVADSWVLTLQEVPESVTTDRLIEKRRIYRTITASNGVSSYFQVAEIDYDQLVYTDNASDEDISGNNILESTLWTPPPADLKGWVAMPNGILAAWRDNEIWFSEPYRPHAWPVSYQVSVDYPIVGLGVMGQTLIIATKGSPWAATGVNPSSISLSKINSFEPCQSRGSIVSTPAGVYYASANGIVVAVPGQVRLITTELISPAQWQENHDLGNIKAVEFEGGYLAYEISTTGSTSGFYINAAQPRIGYNELTDSSNGLVNVCFDPWTAQPLIIRNGYIYIIDHPDGTGQQPFKWRSKKFALPSRKNIAAMKVRFDIPSDAPTLSSTRNTASPQTLASDQYALLRLYADGDLVTTRELRSSNEYIALPSGFKANQYQVEIEGRVSIFDIQMATSSKELKSA
jgi:hypothetical protein